MTDAGKRAKKGKTKKLSQDLMTDTVHDLSERVVQERVKVIKQWGTRGDTLKN